ncbi:UEV domain-containing protein [Cladorrhinum samala]|uniref:UEV domain-containing protein n=1 Tax=Cladorrhinum samala TaxID=585594 RepID=A0AAV9HIQ8_9PEZI|nr:UEV domain-containing protein [Cladorrhinum samala]
MVVQQHVLNWLYSVLTSEYHDVNRTYSDVAQALSHYPSLSPRTDVHTFPNGSSALLLHLTGTIPVLFRGTTYRFPISLWVPHAYPREAPLVYVTPTETMVVRPGQHVDPQGQVYHPYLVGWTTFWDKSTILDFLAILRDVFAKEPPVVARQQGAPPPPPQQSQSPAPPPPPPPVPPLPTDLAPPRPASQGRPPALDSASRPPPPPPKPGAAVDPRHQASPGPNQFSPPPSQFGGSPAVPPLPPKPGRPTSQYLGDGHGPQQEQYARAGPSRYDSAPPLPVQAIQSPPAPAPGRPPPPPSAQHTPPSLPQYHSPPPQAAVAATFSPSPPHHPQFQPANSQRLPTFSPPQQYSNPVPGPPQWQQPPPHHPQAPPQQVPKPAPAPNLLDSDLSLPISSSTLPPPPIPPNPEKDALLHQLAQTLYIHRQRAREQNDSSLSGLEAQRQAMLSASHRIQAESAQLSQLSALLTSNTAILQDSLRKADAVIESSSSHPEPNVDELLVAPTVVGNQLYELVAEERALSDAIFMLGRAVERERISPQMFAKLTRSLAREWYLKKALVRKIGTGMGLATY